MIGRWLKKLAELWRRVPRKVKRDLGVPPEFDLPYPPTPEGSSLAPVASSTPSKVQPPRPPPRKGGQ